MRLVRPERKRVKNEDPFLSVKDAAEYANISVETIYDRIRKGLLDVQRIGPKVIRIRFSSLMAWMEYENSVAGRPKTRSRAI